jgi:Coenzyme PQQ synthesis protein D (PqqD)
MDRSIYRRSVQLMEAEIADELVALDADAGSCFGFNSVATSVWRKLEEPSSFDQIRSQLLEEYDVDQVQCDKELEELLRDLVAKGLVVKSAPVAKSE